MATLYILAQSFHLSYLQLSAPSAGHPWGKKLLNYFLPMSMEICHKAQGQTDREPLCEQRFSFGPMWFHPSFWRGKKKTL
jgi:hypothetical protein